MVLSSKKLKKITKKKKIIFINICIFIFLFISSLSLINPELNIFRKIYPWNSIDCSIIFSNNIKVTDKIIDFCNKKSEYQLNEEFADINLSNTVNGSLLANINTYIEDDDFKALNERINLHGYLWYSLFENYNIYENDEDFQHYKYKLLYQSSFLDVRFPKRLTGKKKLLATVHRSLYSWAYGHHFQSLSDIIQSSRGQGIVMYTNQKHFQNTLNLLENLRHVIRTTLPIHIFYFGKNGISDSNKEILHQYHMVTYSDLSYYFDWAMNIDGFGMKPFSLLASPFEETILLDDNTVYLQDPGELFKNEGYRKNGSLFLRDQTIKSREGEKSGVHWLKSWLNDPLQETKKLRYFKGWSSQEMDSSTIVIHKTKTILGLLATCKLNGLRIRRKILEKNNDGINESFWIGFDMARQPYYFDSSLPSFIGEMNSETGTLCGYKGHVIDNKLFYYRDDRSTTEEVENNKEDNNNYYFNHNNNLIDKYNNKNNNNNNIDDNKIIPNSYIVEGEGLWDPSTKCYSLNSNEKPHSLTKEENEILHKIIEKE